jgi:hypothetical protein
MATATARKSATRKLVMVDVAKLKRASYNPDSRMSDLGGLMRSMETIGQLIPILVTAKGQIVDGHRRWAAAKKLEWPKIAAIITSGDPAETFAEINSYVKKFSGNETLVTYFAEPRAISAYNRKVINSAEKILGRQVLRKMALGGFSMATYNLAKRVCHVADSSTPENIKTVLVWMLKFRNQGVVKEMVARGANLSKVIRAARDGKEIAGNYEVQ